MPACGHGEYLPRLHCHPKRVGPGAVGKMRGLGFCSQLATGLAGVGMKMKHLVPPCSVSFSIQMSLEDFFPIIKSCELLNMEQMCVLNCTRLPWCLKKYLRGQLWVNSAEVHLTHHMVTGLLRATALKGMS